MFYEKLTLYMIAFHDTRFLQNENGKISPGNPEHYPILVGAYVQDVPISPVSL